MASPVNPATNPRAVGSNPRVFKIVETLISYGADVNKEAAYTKPLAYAIQKKQPKIVEQLINAGAKPDNEILIKALKSNDNYIKDTVLKRYKSMD